MFDRKNSHLRKSARFGLSIACAVGVGTLAVGLATYLSANDSGSAAVAVFIIAPRDMSVATVKEDPPGA